MRHRVPGIVAAVAVTLGSVSAPNAYGSPPRAASDRAATSSANPRLASPGAESTTLSVHVTPLVMLTTSDARGRVTVPRHSDNRVLRVILESEQYYSCSEIQLDGGDAALTHFLQWRGLPPGAYSVTVELYGPTGLRASTRLGGAESQLNGLVPPPSVGPS